MDTVERDLSASVYAIIGGSLTWPEKTLTVVAIVVGVIAIRALILAGQAMSRADESLAKAEQALDASAEIAAEARHLKIER